MKLNRSRKYIVLAIFLVVTVISFLLMSGVQTNYNISDYLDESTETKISLNIIEEDFGMTGNIQVMVENVSVDEAYKISSAIKEIDNVLFVNFDENDPAYYKNGHALFAVVVNGDEYSSTANQVLDDIQVKLNNLLENKINLGGSVVEKRNMRNTLKVEISQQGTMCYSFDAVAVTPAIFKPGVYDIRLYQNGDLCVELTGVNISGNTEISF